MALWSDRAAKTRFAAIPNGTTIGFQPMGDWTLPEGSVLSTSLETNSDLQNPAWLPAVIVDGYPIDNLDRTEVMKLRSREPIGTYPQQFIHLRVERP